MKPERWQRIEQLYHAALERDADHRASFLAEACAGDASLRSELEALLAANDEAGGFLATPALELEAKRLAAERPAAPLAVEVGQELSHYKILSRIGAGGMGEVFLAQDKILERRVALKLLPAQFTQNEERLQRFIREAKAASALNHPNIITIYEIGEVDNTHFIATEFIEGETLRTWTVDKEKRLPQTLSNVSQVASALDAAHKAGIVHRDIKPENVMVRPDGLVKVLDFGLAKLTLRATGSVDPEAQTWIEGVKTVPGMILGTLRYMSPEQARGRSVDARSDVFSLGVVFYELLTGHPLFAGESDADVIAAIIHKEAPPLATYLSEVPPELERIVQKALAKDRERRYQSAHDLQIDLQTLKENSDLNAWLARAGPVTTHRITAQTSSAMTVPRFSLRQLFLGLLIAVLIGAIWWLTLGRSGQVKTPPPESLKNDEVVTWQSAPGEGYSVGSFSPDGKWVAFTSTKGGSKNIWIKQASTGDAEPSTRDEFENQSPIWSPTGDEIAFFSHRGNQAGIWRKPPLGGSPILLKSLAPDEGDTRLRRWSKNGATIYYELKRNLFALDVNSGQTNQLTDLDMDNVTADSLIISRDEQRVVYATSSDAGVATLYLLPIRGAQAKPIAQMSASIRNTVWHPDGERIFFSAAVDGTYQIFVADIDGHKPVQITFGDKDSLVLDVSDDGSKVLYGSSKEESDVWGVNVAKAEEFPVASDINSEFWPSVSPDSRTLAYQSGRNLSQSNKIFYSSIVTRSLDTSAQPAAPIKEGALLRWSPDGKRQAFLRLSNKALGLWAINATGEEKRLTADDLPSVRFSILPYQRLDASSFDWSPDSSRIVYCSQKNDQRNLRLVAADGSSDTALTDNADPNLDIRCPLWSADGRLVAYSSNPVQIAADRKVAYKVWIADAETKGSKMIFEADSFLRLIGWSQPDQELILATVKGKTGTGKPTEVQLLRVSIRTGEQRLIATLSATYLYNIHLSANGRMIAFSSHHEDKDNIWIISSDGGGAKKLTSNSEPRLYFSSLAWSPDGRAIYFGKQARFSQLWMITNFK